MVLYLYCVGCILFFFLGMSFPKLQPNFGTMIVHLRIKLHRIVRLKHNPNIEHLGYLGYLHLGDIISNIRPSSCAVSSDLHSS